MITRIPNVPISAFSHIGFNKKIIEYPNESRIREIEIIFALSGITLN